MSTLFDRQKEVIPDAIFHPPATETQIVRVERLLETKFPEWLGELYRCCNGIQSKTLHHPYLYAVEDNDDFSHSLLSWNRFIRNNWETYAPQYKADFPEVDWDSLDPRHLILIGGVNGTDWAIDPRGSPKVIWYDVQDAESRIVLGEDLAEVCLKERLQDEEIRDQFFRGRSPYRREADHLPPANDIEFILDTLIEICRGSRSSSLHMREVSSPGWSLYRGISQQPDEPGMLFVFRRDSWEIQVATRDGNLPFIIRTKLNWQKGPLQCLVKELAETFLCFLYLTDSPYWGSIETEQKRCELESRAQMIWKHRYGPDDPKLQLIAETLFWHDDRRIEERAPLGE